MCNCNNNQKNQTSKTVSKFLLKSENKDSNGVGFFLVPDPEAGILEFKVVVVENIGFKETVKRGQTCEAFKFIPFGIELETVDGKQIVIDLCISP
ncbi:hypothetical protein ACS5NO_32150 [Larkinella sp. GY13]|uniref:hypothetical protein n=1 Tax=Larkinella sp. GY13 TaxID=3453720 RepID=UPI003EE85EDC